MTISPIEVVERYQAAFSKLMDNDQPTIKQHLDFIEQMYICAAAGTIDSDIYLRIAEAHKQIIKTKLEMSNGR